MCTHLLLWCVGMGHGTCVAAARITHTMQTLSMICGGSVAVAVQGGDKMQSSILGHFSTHEGAAGLIRMCYTAIDLGPSSGSYDLPNVESLLELDIGKSAQVILNL
eukprot:jgi/Ulvmu1/7092/UM033_0153.1